MGWERRGGNVYYYTKWRDGETVRSRYVGRGEVAEIAARLDEINRRAVQRIEPSPELIAAGEAAAEFHERAQAVARNALLASGYHQHNRGEWRKRRGKAS